MDLGIDDVVAGAGEKPTMRAKRSGWSLVWTADLQAFAPGWVGPHDGLVAEDAVVQRAGVPGDFFRRMAQEIDGVELFPQALMDGVREGEKRSSRIASACRSAITPWRAGASPCPSWWRVWW